MKKEKISLAMNNIKSQYIQEAENYSLSTKTLKKAHIFKFSIVAAVILCLVSGTVVFAGNHYFNWNSSITFHDGTTVDVSDNIPFKKIPETIPIIDQNKDDKRLQFSHAEIEEMLGFNILSSKNADTDILVYDTYLNKNGSIARVSLYWNDFIRESDSKYIFASISMLNENAEEGYIIPFKEGLDAAGGKEYSNTYYLENLDTSVVIYYSDFDNRPNATFIYDNVYYQFTGYDYTEEEFVKILGELE